MDVSASGRIFLRHVESPCPTNKLTVVFVGQGFAPANAVKKFCCFFILTFYFFLGKKLIFAAVRLLTHADFSQDLDGELPKAELLHFLGRHNGNLRQNLFPCGNGKGS